MKHSNILIVRHWNRRTCRTKAKVLQLLQDAQPNGRQLTS